MAEQGSANSHEDEQDGAAGANLRDKEMVESNVLQEDKGIKVTSSSKKSSKKKKKGKKAEGATAAATYTEQGPSKPSDGIPPAVNMQTLRQIQKAMEQLMTGDKPARSKSEAKQRKYVFWDTQPVPKIGSLGHIFILLFFCAVHLLN